MTNSISSPVPFKPSLISTALLAVLLFLFFWLPSFATPLYSRGESRESVVVLDMLNQQNAVLPLRNGVEIPSKPPLFHWLALAAERGLGNMDAPAVRFPSALASALLVAVLVVWLAERVGREFALLSAALLLSSLTWMRYSALARVDMVFGLALNFALLAGYEILRRERSERWSLFLALAAALALAVLAKGPSGLVLPPAACGLWLLLNALTEGPARIKHFPWLKVCSAILAGGALAMIWYYAAWLQGGDRFLDVHLMRENLARLTGDKDYVVGHQHGVPYVFGQLLIGFLPWGLMLPFVAVALWQRRTTLFSKEQLLIGLSASWALVLIAAVCVSSSKRGVYLLPISPALAILTAEASMRPGAIIGRFGRFCQALASVPVRFLSYFWLLLLLLMAFIFYLLPAEHLQFALSNTGRALFDELRGVLAGRAWALLLLLGFAVVLQLRAARKWCSGNYSAALQHTAAIILSLNFFGALLVHGPVAAALSPRALFDQLAQAGCADYALVDIEHYPSIFYARQNLTVLNSKKLIKDLGQAPAQTCLLVPTTEYQLHNERWQICREVKQTRLPVFYGKDFLTVVRCDR